jgi:viroplasmin and RNaseH domain-containing protein
MSDSKAQCFFVVFEGKTLGIYSSWNDAGEEVLGWPNARFSKYNSYGHAWNAWDSHCKKKKGRHSIKGDHLNIESKSSSSSPIVDVNGLFYVHYILKYKYISIFVNNLVSLCR